MGEAEDSALYADQRLQPGNPAPAEDLLVRQIVHDLGPLQRLSAVWAPHRKLSGGICNMVGKVSGKSFAELPATNTAVKSKIGRRRGQRPMVISRQEGTEVSSGTAT